MTYEGKYVYARPLILPKLERVRENEDDFLEDLIAGGSELRNFLADCSKLVPRIDFEPINTAALIGMMVRLLKLYDSYLMMICEHRLEITFILGRCLYDTAIDVIYFCRCGDQSKIAAFIDTSLATDKKIYEEVRNDELTGSGDRVVGKRIMDSIEATFEEAGRALGDIDSKKWRRRELVSKRAQDVGLGDLDTFFFRSKSRAIHTSWSELARYHLIKQDNFWLPNLNFAPPRPQIVEGISIVTALATQVYAKSVANCQPMSERALTIKDWFISMASKHEEFLRSENDEDGK